MRRTNTEQHTTGPACSQPGNPFPAIWFPPKAPRREVRTSSIEHHAYTDQHTPGRRQPGELSCGACALSSNAVVLRQRGGDVSQAMFLAWICGLTLQD